MKKAQSKFIKRIIAAVCLFFVPLLTQIILDLTGLTNAGVDATCGINQIGGV